jgi:putative ABC transport system permease protein
MPSSRVLLSLSLFGLLILLLNLSSQTAWPDVKDKIKDPKAAPDQELAKTRMELLATKKALSEAKQNLSKTQADLTDTTKACDKVKKEFAAEKTAHKAAATKVDAAAKELAHAKAELAAKEKLLAKSQMEVLACQKEGKKVKSDLDQAKTDLKASEKELTETKETLADTQKKYTACQDSLKVSEAARAKALKEFQTERAAHQATQARLKTTTQNLAQAVANAEIMQKVLARAKKTLANKQEELAVSQKTLEEVQLAWKQLRTALADEIALHQSTNELLGGCIQGLLQFHEEAEARGEVLTKTQFALKKAKAKMRRNRQRQTMMERTLANAQTALVETQQQAKAAVVAAQREAQAALAKAQGEILAMRGALTRTKEEAAAKDKALGQLQKVVQQTQLQLQATMQALKKSENAQAALRDTAHRTGASGHT